MEEMLNYSFKVLRERYFSRPEEDVQQAILSFVDENSKPSKLGCKTLAMHSSMLGHMNITTRLEVLPMELLMACDKA